ncbi:MAG TPA: FAD-dependent oxidoreductase [Usitatibacter sp.]|nr:FAD-dependent oxidoreductase [Usitatibacter sp.]
MLATRPPATASRLPQHETVAPPLTGGARVEVCVAGTGLAGMMAAYLLARDRRSVMVIDEGPIGGAPGGAEVAHLASMIEQPYHHLARLHGEDASRLGAKSTAAALDSIEAIVRRERISCEFERLDGYAFGLPVEVEVRAARKAGVRGVEALSAPPIEGCAERPCVRYPAQALFHPPRFLAGLASATAREGGRIHCGVGIKAIQPHQPSSLLTTGGHRIDADMIVSRGPEARVSRIVNVIGLRIPRGCITRALYWDSSGPTRCARLRSVAGGGEVLLVGGEDSPAGLEAWARLHFPRAGDVVQRFTAGLPPPADLFAVVGSGETDSGSNYVCTSSWGTLLTRAAIAGMAIRDCIEGARTPWGDLYTGTHRLS